MEREEKLKKVLEAVENFLKILKGKCDFVSGVHIPVSIKEYFPNDKESFGSFIDKLYDDQVEILSPLAPPYSMVNTPANRRRVSYSELTSTDIDALYKMLVGEKIAI